MTVDLDTIALILGTGGLTAFVTQLFNMKKARADAEKVKAEAAKVTVDSDTSLSGATMEYARLLQEELKTLKTELIGSHSRAVELEVELTRVTRRADELSEKVRALEERANVETKALAKAQTRILELSSALREKDPAHPLLLNYPT